MRNVILVVKHEITTMLGKRSFWLTTFLLPGIIIALSLGQQVLGRSSLAQGGDGPFSGGAADGSAIGYVDEAGVIKEIPEQVVFEGVGDSVFFVTPGDVRRFPDRASAQVALEAGTLRQYYIVPADFLATGSLTLVDSHFSLFNSLDSGSFFEYIITYNLAGDARLARLLSHPMLELESQRLSQEPRRIDPDGPEEFTAPFAVMFVFFFVLTMSSGFMLQSVAQEKENRTVEVLLLSLRPRDLMLGKVLGLGAVALLQVAIWLGGGALIMGSGQSLVAGLATLPEGFVVWALLYFVLGYLLYASILGAIGALSPTTREGAQFTFIVALPLMLPLWMISAFTDAPDGGLTVFLSLFPLTAPTSMITRMVATRVPVWQLLAGLAGLALTAYLLVSLSARLFRADTLLSLDSLNWRRLFRELRRREG